MAGGFVLALDQGTTGSTALVVDVTGAVRARGYAEVPQHYPRPGWVEHDPEDLWTTVERAATQALKTAGITGDGHEAMVRERTGLVLDAYFSGTKIAWILDQVPDARRRAARGQLAFGTVDTWLLWKLTRGRVHATDASNASRTLCLNLSSVDWDERMCALLRVPREVLPTIVDSSGPCGEDRKSTRL